MGRRKKAKSAQALLEQHTAGGAAASPIDKTHLADCLSQTSKIAAECNSILRDLLRGRSPQHQDLQRLASQVLMGQSLGLNDLQRKMESQQATLAELLKMLKPAAGEAAFSAQLAADSDTSAMLASYAAQQPSLSIVKGWDALNLLTAPMRRRKGQQKVDRRPESAGAAGTKRERCVGVEAYWRQLEPHQRRQIMRAPLGKMVEAVRAEQGDEGVRDLAEALALLRQQGGRCAAYWRCPCCDTRRLDAAGFVQHLQLYHEEVQYALDGGAVQCTKCLREVVGAHYQNEEPGFPTVVLCMTCCWEEQILQTAGGDDSGSAMQLRMPQPGQRLLPPVAPPAPPSGPGDDAVRWAWPDSVGRRRSNSGLTSSLEEDETDSSSEESSSSDSESEGEGAAAAGGARRGGGQRQQQPTLQQQMEQEVHNTGGLLAAVARRLDALALVPGEAAAEGAAGSSGSGMAFEQTLLTLVAQAQRLLSVPAGPEDDAAATEGRGAERRLELEVKLAAHEAFPNQEELLHSALCLLSSRELQCLLGYAIARHAGALGPLSGAAGGELLSISAASALAGGAAAGGRPVRRRGGSSGGSGSTPDLGSPTGSGMLPFMQQQHQQQHRAVQPALRRVRQQVHQQQAQAQLQAASYDPGCASVFTFDCGDSGSDGQLRLEDVAGGAGGSSEEGGSGAALLQQQLLALRQQPGSLLQDLPAGMELSGEECLEPHLWWTDHLAHKTWHDFPEDAGGEVYLLQWIYGNVAHAPTEDFLERQRVAAGAKGCDNAVMDCLAELADVWRQLAAATARKRHLQSLRDGVREEAAAVRSFEEAGAAALRTQAAEFYDEVGGSGSPCSSPGAGQPAAGGGGVGQGMQQWSQRALGKLQRFHQLKDESSIRYAQALIDREVAVLELAEEMDLHELQMAAAEVASIEAALGDARCCVAEAEAERQRLATEGPASHRKKDLLDKVNKEAEHRERLQELQRRIAAAQERIFSEEGFQADARKRHEELAVDLDEVRAELAAFLERRTALDRACHDVLTAQERDRDQHLTDAHVDQRIRAVWQVVTGVAEAIRLLHDRYAPDAQSKEAERHIRCTGLAQGVCDELEERASAWWADLDRLRRRAVDLACSDASAVVEQAALEVIRTQLEDAAVAAREAATLDLLRELELEEAAQKASTEGKKGKKKKKKGGRAAEEEEEEAEEEEQHQQRQQRQAGKGRGGKGSGAASSGDSSGEDGGAAQQLLSAQQILSSLDHLAPEIRAELEYEAALERRRQELEVERVRREQDMLRLAQEASLREHQQAPAGGGKAGKVAAVRGASSTNGSTASGKGNGATATAGDVKSPSKAASAATNSTKSAPSTPGKVKAAGAAAAASTGGRVITVAVAAVRGGSASGARQPTSPAPPPPPGSRSPAKSASLSAPAVLPLAPAPSASGPAAAAADNSGGIGSVSTSSLPHKCEMRVTSYYGDWRCFCGETNRLWDTCACGQIPPCRDWVRGRCTYKTRCRFAHPPFELPDSLPRPKSPIAKPAAEATVYSKGGVAAAGSKGAGASKAAAGAAGGGPQAVGTPDAPAVVAAPRVVSVTKSSGGMGQRAVQLVKAGGRAGNTVALTGKAAAAAAAAAAADALPPPPLKPAPWANIKPGAAAAAAPPAAPPAAVGGPAPSVAEAAAGAAMGPSGFSLFGGSSPLLLSSLGGSGSGEAPLVGIAPDSAAAEAAPVPAGLGAFGGSGGSLFGGGIFSAPGAEQQHAALMMAHHQQQQQQFQQHQQAQQQPMSPSHLSAAGSSMPQSPLLLSPQQQQMVGAGAPPSLPFLHQQALADLPLSGSMLGSPSAAGLDIPGFGAFHQHAAAFGSNGGSGGLDFGGSSLLGGFGSTGGGFGGGGLGGLGGGGSGMASGGGGGMDEWADLQQQLPSDLGAMLGSDPSLQHKQAQQQQHQQQGGQPAPDGGLYAGGAHTWF